ncbi:hypothetical protein [Allorhodopirellula heiligendammensis]|uniref:Uncharacterized protein n=1 Tax=Allorhodopirellula heiligendammensis TaxID=2714739 RepID=A0A5C6B1P7_9BACT|nr:hypothetical protein [Allorhodopirellula heiligendammensis]TWU05342.1 hypothetical protein Poly21_57490 [Allorhodopirellula heiligendammensis]
MQNLKPRFSILNGLSAVAVCALLFFAMHRYQLYQANYAWPDQAIIDEHYRAFTPQEIANISEVGARQHSADLRNKFPPRGLQYWLERASLIQPEMTEFALRRHMPQAARYQLCTINGLPMPEEPQVSLLLYAVDSELAFACVMEYERVDTGTGITQHYGRVKDLIGFFEHNGELDNLGILTKTKFDMADRIAILSMSQAEKVEP